jgi:hypothetical protein
LVLLSGPNQSSSYETVFIPFRPISLGRLLPLAALKYWLDERPLWGMQLLTPSESGSIDTAVFPLPWPRYNSRDFLFGKEKGSRVWGCSDRFSFP